MNKLNPGLKRTWEKRKELRQKDKDFRQKLREMREVNNKKVNFG